MFLEINQLQLITCQVIPLGDHVTAMIYIMSPDLCFPVSGHDGQWP